MEPGSPTADGLSPGSAFNPASAALFGITNNDPFLQAVLFAVSNFAPTNRAEEMQGVVLRGRAGEYPQTDVTFPGGSSVTIIMDGPTRFGASGTAGTTDWRYEVTPIAFGSPQFPILSIGQEGRPGTIQVFSDLVLSNGSSGQLVGVKSSDVSWEDISEDTLTGLSLLVIEGGSPEVINVPSALLYMFNPGGGFASDNVTVGRLQTARSVHFQGNIIVSSAPFPPDDDGILNCRIDGNWTGPAGTARFDKFTQDNFGGVFAGGAGPGDYLEA